MRDVSVLEYCWCVFLLCLWDCLETERVNLGWRKYSVHTYGICYHKTDLYMSSYTSKTANYVIGKMRYVVTGILMGSIQELYNEIECWLLFFMIPKFWIYDALIQLDWTSCADAQKNCRETESATTNLRLRKKSSCRGVFTGVEKIFIFSFFGDLFLKNR